jgi:hypothetical protein
MAILNRPMFNDQAQNSGIVSTVADVPSAPVNPELETQLTTDLQQEVDTAMNQEVAATSAQLDSAESVDDMLAAMGGTATNTEQARTELAALVGEQDAQATPESVLPITQTTLQLIQSVESTNGQGGLGSLLGDPGDLTAQTMGTAVGDPTSPVAAPTMPMPADFNPMVGFNLGGFNDLNPMGPNPIYGNINANNPLLAPIGSSAAVDAAQQQAVAQQSLIAPNPQLPEFRGTITEDEFNRPQQVSNLWSLEFGKQPTIDTAEAAEEAELYRDTVKGALPTVDTVEDRVGRRLDQLSPYIPEKKTAEQLLQERKQLMGDYLVENPDYEQVLAEYQGDYGDVQKDLETQGWLELAKFGGAIATSSKNPFHAIANAIPGLADGIGTLAKEKSAIDRQIRLNARGEYKRLEDLRNQQQMAMAQGAYDEERATTNEINEIERGLRSAAIEAFNSESSAAAQRQWELMTGSMNWGQAMAQMGAEAAGANARHRDQMLQDYALKPVEYFQYVDPASGETKYGAGRYMPYGLFGLDGEYIDAAQIVPMDAAAYARRTGTSAKNLQSKEMILLGDEFGPTGYQAVAGAFDPEWGLYYRVGEDGTPTLLTNPDSFMLGNLQDIQTVTSQEDGTVKLTNMQTGKTVSTQLMTRDGELVSVQVPERLQIDPSTNPYAKENDRHTIPADWIGSNERQELLASIMTFESGASSLLGFLERNDFTSVTGPAASIKALSTNIAAFIPSERWSEMMSFMKTEGDYTQLRLAVEELVQMHVKSSRFPSTQVDFVREMLADNPMEFFRNPVAARERFIELARDAINSYHSAVGQLTNEPYYSIDKQPSGTRNDPYMVTDERAVSLVNTALQNAATGAPNMMEGKFLYMPVPEGEDDKVQAMLEAIKSSSGRPVMQWMEPSRAQGGLGRGIWFQYGKVDQGTP